MWADIEKKSLQIGTISGPKKFLSEYTYYSHSNNTVSLRVLRGYGRGQWIALLH